MKTLELMHIADLFPIVVTPEDVTHGKPSPEMFLLARERRWAWHRSAVTVFEDAGPGFEAAIAAGMQYVRGAEPHDLKRAAASQRAPKPPHLFSAITRLRHPEA